MYVDWIKGFVVCLLSSIAPPYCKVFQDTVQGENSSNIFLRISKEKMFLSVPKYLTFSMLQWGTNAS